MNNHFPEEWKKMVATPVLTNGRTHASLQEIKDAGLEGWDPGSGDSE
jgi:hypothetical protein